MEVIFVFAFLCPFPGSTKIESSTGCPLHCDTDNRLIIKHLSSSQILYIVWGPCVVIYTYTNIIIFYKVAKLYMYQSLSCATCICCHLHYVSPVYVLLAANRSVWLFFSFFASITQSATCAIIILLLLKFCVAPYFFFLLVPRGLGRTLIVGSLQGDFNLYCALRVIDVLFNYRSI